MHFCGGCETHGDKLGGFCEDFGGFLFGYAFYLFEYSSRSGLHFSLVLDSIVALRTYKLLILLY